jgi:serine phosphatase RsbU (regulator of sigma subunit)
LEDHPDIIKPVILLVEPDRVSLGRVRGLFGGVVQAYELIVAADADDLLRRLDRMVLEGVEIAMTIVSSDGNDQLAVRHLRRAYEKWPHGLRILITDGPENLDADEVEAAKIFRIFYRPLDEITFGLGLREASRFYLQQQEVTQKARILTELHRASMSITGEIQLHKLLHKLMRLVVENADARKGYILMEDADGRIFIEASGTPTEHATQTGRAEISDFSPVCPAVVEYVVRTRENIILHDALKEGNFLSHPYIRKNLCRSILCTPLIYQGKLYGILYLENSEKTHAFSNESLELLRLLTAPAAIAIQNAQLYSYMEAKVEERTREVKAQKEEIERSHELIRQKNDDIISSINYARRIQDAFLPSLEGIKKTFPQSLVYYKPKDIVSGDFYWFSRRLSKAIIAAADCTGHGIPGAFMTIMANTLLRQIVELEGIFKPDEILYHLNLRVRVALQQETESTEAGRRKNQDGLDIALLQVDTKRGKLQYAGANRPLLIVRANGEIEEIKGDKQGIGGYQIEEVASYTTHTFEMEAGDTVYIYSDGYPDQIGEEINKRFQGKRFQTFLQEIHDKDMEYQRLLLDAELRHWRGDMEQTDDVVVIGIRF